MRFGKSASPGLKANNNRPINRDSNPVGTFGAAISGGIGRAFVEK